MVHTWQIHEDAFEPEKLQVHETLYTIGNGYFGTRGSFEEGYPGSAEATLLAGIFDDILPGKEELANAPDWLPIRLLVNGEHFRLDHGRLLTYNRTLDICRGVLTRTLRWVSPRGIELSIALERFVSLADEHSAAQRYLVTIEDLPRGMEGVDVVVWAAFNCAVGNDNLLHWQPVAQQHVDDLLWLHSQTRHSHVQLVQAMSFATRTPGFQRELLDLDFAPSIRLQGRLARGESMTAEKLVVMYTSRDSTDPRSQALEHLRRIIEDGEEAHDRPAPGSDQASSHTQVSPYAALLTRHEAAWRQFWSASDVIIEGDDKAQQLVRYSIYQLCINAPTHDASYSIAAKGLTGTGYHGHILHDTEIFMLPFFIYSQPAIARNLLLYRYHLLPGAYEKAKSNNYRGAQYPWESTLDGKEATPFAMVQEGSSGLQPVFNGEVELHISSAVAFATWQYWRVTGDDGFMRDCGAEILCATAQFWCSRAQRDEERQVYEIRNVIGPDEWHEHVNNDAYTNVMAQWNIQTALDIWHWLGQDAPAKAEELAQKLSVNDQQLEHWRDVATRLYIPLDRQKGLFEQFSGFFKLEPFDQEKYKDRTSSYQKMLSLQALQRYQIIKQADVLMFMTLLRDHFDLPTKHVNWEYYYPITDHEYGSSLSPALHAILACELGLDQLAYEHLLQGAQIDFKNGHKDTAQGIHLASCGAVWQAVVFGFAGLLLTDDGYVTRPCWPSGWTRIAFTFQHKGQSVAIDLRRGSGMDAS